MAATRPTPHRIAACWAAALGYVAELALIAAGATAVPQDFYGEHLGHVVMLDPERNEFCVALRNATPSGYRHLQPASQPSCGVPVAQ